MATLRIGLGCALGLGLVLACEKKAARSPGEHEDQISNLCTKYETCDECIAGERKTGITERAAQTECGAAVLGCWTTWETPIKCGRKTRGEKPEL
jgi:hypothetical protein